MSYVLCLIFGVVIGACGMWAAMASPPREDFRDAGWRRRLRDLLEVEEKDGGGHLRRVDKAVVPMRRCG